MNKEMLKNILIVFLAGITIFSVFKYVSSLQEKKDLWNNLKEAEDQISALENDKENLKQELNKKEESKEKLSAELLGLKEYLRASKKRLTKLFNDYGQAQWTIDDLSSKFSILKTENIALVEQKDKLDAQFQQVSQENEGLKAKLSSIPELKKAIRDLKKQMRKVTHKATKTKTIIEGNRGFLIKDGKPTSIAKIKIEVIPVPQSK